jgi:hypothetical protein
MGTTKDYLQWGLSGIETLFFAHSPSSYDGTYN